MCCTDPRRGVRGEGKVANLFIRAPKIGPNIKKVQPPAPPPLSSPGSAPVVDEQFYIYYFRTKLQPKIITKNTLRFLQ